MGVEVQFNTESGRWLALSDHGADRAAAREEARRMRAKHPSLRWRVWPDDPLVRLVDELDELEDWLALPGNEGLRAAGGGAGEMLASLAQDALLGAAAPQMLAQAEWLQAFLARWQEAEQAG